MSGVELAGLVLGAIPLVIAALENYEEGLGKVKAFWKWEDQLSDAIRKLWYHYTSYELTIRVLLSSITSDADLEDMLGNADSTLWGDLDLDARLQEKLSTAYKPYLFTMKEIEQTISDIASSLNLDRASSITTSDLQAMVVAHPRKAALGNTRGFQFSKRVKFTMKKQKVKRLLDQLEQSVTRLDSFNEKSEKLEPYRNNRKSNFAVPLIRIQKYARSLHTVLNQFWTTSASSCFSAHLLLEQRLARSKNLRKRDVKENSQSHDKLPKFTFSIPDTQLRWRMAEILVVESMSEPIKTHSKVAIAVSPPSPTFSPVHEIDHLALSEVRDLRSAIHSFENGYPGFCLDHTEGKLKGTYTPSRSLSLGENNFIKLSDILCEGSPKSSLEKLTRVHCYDLAVTLSSSLLQLHATPWLTSRLSKHDIVFPDTLSGNIPAQILHPYIAHACSAACDCQVVERNNSHIASTDDSTRLLDLGILLLEIYFNQPLESFYKGDAIAARSELTDLGVVKHWMTREKGNLSWAFQNAVSHCLRCFADPNANLQDADFRQGVIEQVLLPLQDELYIWKDGPTKS